MNSFGCKGGRNVCLEPMKKIHDLDIQERRFLESVEKGDQQTMMRCLQGHRPVNVNCTNLLGRSAIQIAVENENIEIVELLLKQKDVKIGDALLCAIDEGGYQLVELLINHPSIKSSMLGTNWSKYKMQLQVDESSEYFPDISPVILAAQCNQFEILQLLLSRGAKIDRPHPHNCQCKRCKKQMRQDSLRYSLYRIYTYSALASPAWMSLTSPDPLLTAFKLSWELHYLSTNEKEFKELYAKLRDQCKQYACDLLEQCRSTEEVIDLLNREDGEDGDEEEQHDTQKEDEEDNERVTLDRLKLAIKYNQKQVGSYVC